MTKHQSFRIFNEGYSAIDKQPKHLFVFGNCRYFIDKAAERFKAQCFAHGASNTCSIEASSLTEHSFSNLINQKNFFEPSPLYVFRRCEDLKTLQRLIIILGETPETSIHGLFLYEGEGIAESLRSQLAKSRIPAVSCLEPWPNEILQIAKDLAKDLKLSLTQDALSLFIEVSGNDLSILHNEMRKIQLIFHGETQSLNSKTIAPYLGVLREDDVFALANFFLAKDWAKAQILVRSLLQRGESALGILAIISNHCRNAIRIAKKQSSSVKLPPMILKKYTHAYANSNISGLIRSLDYCQKTEIQLKTSKFSEEVALSSLIDHMRDPSAFSPY